MRAMTRSEIDAFLSEALIARLATVRPDGRPHVVPVWFWWDGESLYLETGPDFVKVKNLRHNPACAVTIDMTEGGLRFKAVILEGRAELLTKPQVVRDMVDCIYTKYLGREGILAPIPTKMRESEHVIIRLVPERVLNWDDTDVFSRHGA